jgi:hypothetical protein
VKNTYLFDGFFFVLDFFAVFFAAIFFLPQLSDVRGFICVDI